MKKNQFFIILFLNLFSSLPRHIFEDNRFRPQIVEEEQDDIELMLPYLIDVQEM
jgi:hypothetical protein